MLLKCRRCATLEWATEAKNGGLKERDLAAPWRNTERKHSYVAPANCEATYSFSDAHAYGEWSGAFLGCFNKDCENFDISVLMVHLA